MPLLIGSSPTADEGFPTDAGTLAILGDSSIVLCDGSVEDVEGCRWKWSPGNAIGPKPGPREQSGDRSYNHGQWDATRYYGPRLIVIPGTVRAPSHAALHAAEQRLRDAITVEPFQLRVVEPGFDGFTMVRQQGTIDWTEDGTPATPHASFLTTLYAPDPLIYSSRERTFDLSFPSISGGATWPKTWPATWDAVVVSGSEILSNPGALPVGLQLHVQGPASTVQIAFPEIGDALNLANPDGGVLLTAGQWLDINTTTRQVLLNGDAGRRSWAYGDFLQLPPRSETKIAIAGTGTTSDSSVSGAYRLTRL